MWLSPIYPSSTIFHLSLRRHYHIHCQDQAAHAKMYVQKVVASGYGSIPAIRLPTQRSVPNCAKTCLLCDSRQSSCKDVDSNCNRLIRDLSCSPQRQRYEYYKIMCQKSCGFCTDNSITTTSTVAVTTAATPGGNSSEHFSAFICFSPIDESLLNRKR